MQPILTSGTVRLDSTKDGKDSTVVAKFKGKGYVTELGLDVGDLVADIPYKTDLRVDVRITTRQMTIDEIRRDEDVEDAEDFADYGPAEPLGLPEYEADTDDSELAVA